MPIPPDTSLKGRRVKLARQGTSPHNSSPFWASVIEDPLNGYIKVVRPPLRSGSWTSKSLVLEVDPPFTKPA